MSPATWPAVFAQARGDFFFVLPESLLVLFALLTLLLDFALDENQKSWNALSAFIGLALSGGALAMFGFAPGRTSAFGNSIEAGSFFMFFGLLALLLAALAILLSTHPDRRQKEQSGERYALILLATAGIMLLACGNDLVVLFVAFETVAVSLYALAVTGDADRGARQGTLRFLLAGAFNAALVAYGFSILYGLGGSTNLSAISARLAELSQLSTSQNLMLGLALATSGGGVLLRLAGVPLHSRVPEVGESAPSTVAGFISVAAKLACFALLLRLLLAVFWQQRSDWAMLLDAAALVAMAIGTLASLGQTNIKRLLAYSAVAQAGYVMLGIAACVNRDGFFNAKGLESAGYYLFAFVIFQMGAFSVVMVLHERESGGEDLRGLRGMLRSHPLAGAAMIVLLLSCVGVPPTAGFVAKWEVVRVLLANQHAGLAWIAVLFAIPPVYPSYRIIKAMCTGEPDASEYVHLSDPQVVALAAMVILTLLLGVFPAPFQHFASRSLAALALR
ncbi:MAG: NADH-quinone oxidoreductase subunit N [Candidatus Acidiferrales bacterium]